MQEYDTIVTLDMQSAPGHYWPGLPWPTCLQCQKGQNSVVWVLGPCITVLLYTTMLLYSSHLVSPQLTYLLGVHAASWIVLLDLEGKRRKSSSYLGI